MPAAGPFLVNSQNFLVVALIAPSVVVEIFHRLAPSGPLIGAAS